MLTSSIREAKLLGSIFSPVVMKVRRTVEPLSCFISQPDRIRMRRR